MEEGDEPSLPPWRNPALVGHGAAERQLLDAYRGGRLHHAWLIGGPSGVGKATLAWRFARFLLANPDPAAHAVRDAKSLAVSPDHAAAKLIHAGSHGDAVALSRAWNEKTKRTFSDIRVDDVRRALGLFQSASAAGGYRVCLIDTAEDLNRSSANALLKIIEEPPPRSLFMILAHRPGQVMPTLASRCRRLALQSLEAGEVVAALRGLGGEVAAHGPERLAAVAARAGGSVGEALRLLGDEAGALDAVLRHVLAPLPKVDWRAVHRLADAVGASDERFALAVEAVLDDVSARLRRGAAANQPAPALARYAAAWERVRAQAREASALNLDKRPVLIGMVGDLAEAAGG